MGRRLLSTSDQPFALEHLDSGGFRKYRLTCMTYQYRMDQIEVEKDDPMIINGPPATAFLNHMPEVVPNLSVHEGSPLMRSAVECELTFSLMLPVFYRPTSQSPTACVGVVECSMKQSSLILIFNDLKRALERVGLSTFNVQECRPCKSICGLKPALDEIEEALDVVCESHQLDLGQVWISYENENHVPSTSSENRQTKQKFALKLFGYCLNSGDGIFPYIKEYHDTCDVLPLKIGEGLAGKTLETYEPYFCRNINEFRDNMLLALLPTNTECSCFVICLRSSHTEDLDYAFEFLWPRSRYHFLLLQSVLLTLKRSLPSFEFASGVQLGNELRIIDVDNSTESGISFIKILEGNRMSPMHKQLPEKERLVTEDITMKECNLDPGTLPPQKDITMKEAVQNDKVSASKLKHKNDDDGVSECLEPRVVKRKLSDPCESGIDSNGVDNRGIQEQTAFINSLRCPGNNELVIEAEYGVDRTLLYLKIPSNVADIKKNIDEKYKLGPGSYKLQFLDFEDEWICLDDDRDWESCNKSCRMSASETIRIRVRPVVT